MGNVTYVLTAEQASNFGIGSETESVKLTSDLEYELAGACVAKGSTSDGALATATDLAPGTDLIAITAPAGACKFFSGEADS